MIAGRRQETTYFTAEAERRDERPLTELQVVTVEDK